MSAGVVRAVCTSVERGTPKKPVERARFLENFGIEGDAHGGYRHRQVSLLEMERRQAFNAKGANVSDGDFGENILLEGVDLRSLPVGTHLAVGHSALLEITQKGKECHAHCAIYERMNDCIMPRDGVFARVIAGGDVTVGDTVSVLFQKAYHAAVLTISDKGARGERFDESGPVVARLLESHGYSLVEQSIIADEQGDIEAALIDLADRRDVALVITTGGTGFSVRDVTPEATLAVADRNAPGIAESIRAYSMTITPRAMLSRGAAVIRGRTVIVNLPGSPKAAREAGEYIIPHIKHGIDILRRL